MHRGTLPRRTLSMRSYPSSRSVTGSITSLSSPGRQFSSPRQALQFQSPRPASETLDETQPLLRSLSGLQQGSTRNIEHTGSLYSAMIFLPPLTKQRVGHYWTTDVVLGFTLLLMNILLQLALTIIVGEHIVSQHTEFKATLLGESFAYTSPWTWLLDHVRERAPDIRDIKDLEVKGMPWIVANRTPDVDDAECCNGYSCSNSGMQCCNRVGARLGNLSKPMGKIPPQNADVRDDGHAFLRKPHSSNKKRKQDDDQPAGDDGETASLCKFDTSNMMTCGPRSYGFLEAWDGLDTNQDGIWTLDEALADEANLGCHIGTPLEEIFRSNCRAIIHDARDLNRHLNHRGPSTMAPFQVPLSIDEYEAVPRPFFNWWRGLVVLCVEADPTQCGVLVSKGVFDGAINAERGWTKGGVKDLDTALLYCQRLLEPGGICEKSMPGYYQLYRSRVSEMCGKHIYSHGSMHVNPFNNRDVMATIRVTYENATQVNEYSSWRYRFFLCMTLLVWYICLLEEVKDQVQFIDFLLCFYVDDTVPIITPGMKLSWRVLARRVSNTCISQEGDSAAPKADAEKEEGEEEEVLPQEGPSPTEPSKSVSGEESDSAEHVQSISKFHWVTCFIITALRFFLLIYLFNVGTTFLLSNQSYLDLLLNAVALAMIFELPCTLYSILFSDPAKKVLEGARTVDYSSYLPHGTWMSIMLSKFFWGCVILPIMIYWAVAHNHEAEVLPTLEALQCTCYQTGPNCLNAEKFTSGWWNGYWAEVNNIFVESQRHHNAHALAVQ